MPLQDTFQLCFIEVALLEQLFNARLVFLPSHAGSNGNKVFDAEDPGRDAFEFYAFGPRARLPRSKPLRSEELHR